MRVNGANCGHEFKAKTGTSSLTYHIKAKHPAEFKLFEEKSLKRKGTVYYALFLVLMNITVYIVFTCIVVFHYILQVPLMNPNI